MTVSRSERSEDTCEHLVNPKCPGRAGWETLADLGLLKCTVKDRPRRAMYADADRETAFRRWQRYTHRCPIVDDELRDIA